jgi:methylase of polypeptide subunit release factors
VVLLELGINQAAAIQKLAEQMQLSAEFFQDLQGISRVAQLRAA